LRDEFFFFRKIYFYNLFFDWMVIIIICRLDSQRLLIPFTDFTEY